MEYKPTIGLEIHAELNTRTKMFCDSLNDPSETHPNMNICPVCMGHPGTLPVVEGGEIVLRSSGKKIKVRRVHLEEDTGRLLHEGVGALVDFNRAGVPLMELVTEPDISSSEEASEFAEELRLILRTIGVSDADMERGQMRLEANVSLDMGTKVELKNINSFNALRRAIEHELKRQE